MNVGYIRFGSAYDACEFINTLEESDLISITSNSESFYVFYKKK